LVLICINNWVFAPLGCSNHRASLCFPTLLQPRFSRDFYQGPSDRTRRTLCQVSGPKVARLATGETAWTSKLNKETKSLNETLAIEMLALHLICTESYHQVMREANLWVIAGGVDEGFARDGSSGKSCITFINSWRMP
jgi:hypothetical protein